MKRLIAALLAIAIIVTVLPIHASAQVYATTGHIRRTSEISTVRTGVALGSVRNVQTSNQTFSGALFAPIVDFSIGDAWYDVGLKVSYAFKVDVTGYYDVRYAFSSTTGSYNPIAGALAFLTSDKCKWGFAINELNGTTLGADLAYYGEESDGGGGIERIGVQLDANKEYYIQFAVKDDIHWADPLSFAFYFDLTMYDNVTKEPIETAMGASPLIPWKRVGNRQYFWFPEFVGEQYIVKTGNGRDFLYFNRRTASYIAPISGAYSIHCDVNSVNGFVANGSPYTGAGYHRLSVGAPQMSGGKRVGTASIMLDVYPYTTVPLSTGVNGSPWYSYVAGTELFPLYGSISSNDNDVKRLDIRFLIYASVLVDSELPAAPEPDDTIPYDPGDGSGGGGTNPGNPGDGGGGSDPISTPTPGNGDEPNPGEPGGVHVGGGDCHCHGCNIVINIDIDNIINNSGGGNGGFVIPGGSGSGDDDGGGGFNLWDWLGGGISGIIGGIAKVTSAIIDGITTVVTSIIEFLVNVVGNFISKLLEILTDIINFIVTSVLNLVRAVLNVIVSFFNGIITNVMRFLQIFDVEKGPLRSFFYSDESIWDYYGVVDDGSGNRLPGNGFGGFGSYDGDEPYDGGRPDDAGGGTSGGGGGRP